MHIPWLILSLLTFARAHDVSGPLPASPAGLAQTFEGHLDVPYGCGVNTDDMPPGSPSSNLAALWLRGAFHDVGKFDPTSAQPVAGLLPYFLQEKENNGIGVSIATNFASKYKFRYSNADFISLAGAVTVMHCGGPMFNMSVGRTDAPTNTSFASLPNSLPDDQVDSYQMIKQKLQRLGLSPIDMVALVTGSHSMGGAHKAISPHATNETFTPFDTTPGVFDNDIFKQLLAGKCVLQTDCNIAKDPELRPFVQLFADDQKVFFEQYKASYIKLMAVGQNTTGWSSQDLGIKVHSNLTEEGGVSPRSSPSPVVVTSKTSTAIVLTPIPLLFSLIFTFLFSDNYRDGN